MAVDEGSPKQADYGGRGSADESLIADALGLIEP